MAAVPLAQKLTEDQDVEAECRDFVEAVWTSVSNKISASWLDHMQAPLAADVALVKLYRIVSVATTSYDGDVKPNEALEKHNPDNEPVPVSIDPWARGSVPTRKLPQGAGSIFTADFDVLERTPSVNSYSSIQSFSTFRSNASKQSKTSGISRIAGKRLGTAGAEGSTSSRENNRGGTGEVFDLDDDGDNDNGNMNATGHLFDMLLKTQRKMNSKANKDSSKFAEEQDEFKVLQNEIDKAAKELKGKKYVLDTDGKPITVMSVKAEYLPPYAVPVGLNITTKVNPDDAAASHEAAAAAKNMKAKKTVRVAGSRDVDDNFFTAVTSLASSLGSGNAINLNPGVSMKSGDGSLREGPPPPMDPKKVSRKNFFSKSVGAASTASRMSQVVEDEGDETAAGASLAEDSFGTAENLQDSLVDGSLSMGRGTGLGAGSGLQTVSMRSSKYPDVDPTEGGRRKASAAPSAQHSARDNTAVVHKGKPAVLPTKPSSKQQEIMSLLVGGSDKEMPRNRDPPHSQIPVVEHRHLAPPMLGKSTGHGIVAINSPGPASPDKSVHSNYNGLSGSSVITGAGSMGTSATANKKGSVKLTEISRDIF